MRHLIAEGARHGETGQLLVFEPDAVGANGFVVVLGIMKSIDATTHAQDAGLLFFQVGLGLHFWLNIVLTLLGYIPGLVHAIWIIARTPRVVTS